MPPRVAVCTWPRPWPMATRFSERVSAHRTGRPTRRASSASSSSSGPGWDLAPKPPPTSGQITRTSLGRQPVELGVGGLDGVGALAADLDDQPVVVPPGDGVAGLDRGGGQALVHHRGGDHDVALVERERLAVERDRHGGVAADLGEEVHVGGQGLDRVGERGEGVEVDHHQLGGVDRGGAGLGHDGGDGLADEPHGAGGEQGPGHLLVDHDDRHQLRQVEVGGGDHGEHAGRRLRPRWCRRRRCGRGPASSARRPRGPRPRGRCRRRTCPRR